jgi:hypothetical protein
MSETSLAFVTVHEANHTLRTRIKDTMSETTNRRPGKERDRMRADARRGRAAAGKGGAASSSDHGFTHGVISIFILFHLIAITFWVLPWNVAPLRGVREIVRPYMVWSGLFQTWDMFAPDPKSINSYIKAVVITENRHIKVWTFPRMEELSFPERYRKERYRKFEEVLQGQQSEALWPDVATHIARLLKSPGDLPDKVLLIQFRADIKLEADESAGSAPQPNVLYEGYVDPGDLK